MQGRFDAPLSVAGRREIAAWKIPAAVAHGAQWISSPLSRAVETALQLSGTAPALAPALTEMDWGAWEGYTHDELRERFGDEFTRNAARGLDFRPPGGESPRDVVVRVARWLESVAKSTQPLVCVTHNGVLGALSRCDRLGHDRQAPDPAAARDGAPLHGRAGTACLSLPSATCRWRRRSTPTLLGTALPAAARAFCNSSLSERIVLRSLRMCSESSRITCSARSGLPDASRRNTSGETRSALTAPFARTVAVRGASMSTPISPDDHRWAEHGDDELAGAGRREHLDVAFEDDVRAIRDVADMHQRLARREILQLARKCQQLALRCRKSAEQRYFLQQLRFFRDIHATPPLPAGARAASAHRCRDPCRLRQNTAWPRAAKGHDVTTFDDDFYRDILEGIAVHADNAFYRDVLDTITRHQAPEVGVALNKNQMASKRWLADALFEAAGSRLGRVLILGGWVGALGAVLLHDRRFAIDGVVSVDIDPRCAPVALALNATHVRRRSVRRALPPTCSTSTTRRRGRAGPADLVINTSCEHLAEFDRWYARIPRRAAAGHAVERLLRLSAST